MGKRQLGELQASELIITFMLSEIAVAPIITTTTPLLHALIPIFLLLTLEIIISKLLMKSNTLKRIFYGTPSTLIRKGVIDQLEMKKQRIEIDELLSELRQKGYSSLSDINYAILEENGKISVFPKIQKSPLTVENTNIEPAEYGISHLIILDGSILQKNLALIGWDMHKLNKQLQKSSIDSSDVFLMTVDDGGRVTIVKKDQK